ncbi:Myb domain protein 65, putative isoform 3 [Hibiscus syriacus]|uniref:Myb domain protein 65, putative isoform 3 n=1 Tax=Hibiscus syriacus TaxID=106335 RepID=A0A6A3AY93_HIBSY|nr:Myb domain protein 65, putative isoform 3 [Hibiscus syriacus]
MSRGKKRGFPIVVRVNRSQKHHQGGCWNSFGWLVLLSEAALVRNNGEMRELREEATEGTKMGIVCLQALQESHSISGTNRLDKGPHDIVQNNSYEIPHFIFNSLKANQNVLPYVPKLPVISASSMLMKDLCYSQYCGFMPSTIHSQNHLRELPTFFPGYTGAVKNKCPLLMQFQDDISDKVVGSFGLSFPIEPDPAQRTPSHLVYSQVAMPFQMSPPSTSGPESDSISPRNSGLLDALLNKAKTLSSAKNHASDKSSNSSTPSDIVEGSNFDNCETEWEKCGEPLSPMGHSATCLFSECISASGSSLDEQLPAETVTGENLSNLDLLRLGHDLYFSRIIGRLKLSSYLMNFF